MITAYEFDSKLIANYVEHNLRRNGYYAHRVGEVLSTDAPRTTLENMEKIAIKKLISTHRN